MREAPRCCLRVWWWAGLAAPPPLAVSPPPSPRVGRGGASLAQPPAPSHHLGGGAKGCPLTPYIRRAPPGRRGHTIHLQEEESSPRWSSAPLPLSLSPPLPLCGRPSLVPQPRKRVFARRTPSCCWISESGTSTSATPLDRGRGRSRLPPYVCETFEVSHLGHLLSHRLREHQVSRQAV